MPHMFLTIEPTDWQAARELGASLHGWIFRGHANADNPLETTLYRAANRRTGPLPFLFDWEERILRQFQRRAHHYVSDLPRRKDRLEWLALIQHYGGPTRLLDFSYSFYLAAFFAIEKPKRREAAAIWAVNHARLGERIAVKFKANWPPKSSDRMNIDHIGFVNDFLARKREPEPFVISVAPERMNERLSIQQGLFLVPCDISVRFEENLAATFSLAPESLRHREAASWKGKTLPEEIALVKIRLPRHLHTIALRDLYAMNVTSASLFPGLDGFARSLYHEIRLMSES
jgi:FRG domain